MSSKIFAFTSKWDKWDLNDYDLTMVASGFGLRLEDEALLKFAADFLADNRERESLTAEFDKETERIMLEHLAAYIARRVEGGVN